MRIQLSIAIGSLLALPAQATDVTVSVQIPQMKVAEYHRPYVAIWIEPKGSAGAARNLAVWYDHDMKNNEGTKWLRDVRQWWRKTGRTLHFPADGITGATTRMSPGATPSSWMSRAISLATPRASLVVAGGTI